MFPYKICIDWLREQSRQLEIAGCQVEVIQNEIQLPTITLKVGTLTALADLVVWEYGRASMQIFSLKSEKYILEKHDVDLSAEGFRGELAPFFQQVAATVR